jgi:hypothetical protein
MTGVMLLHMGRGGEAHLYLLVIWTGSVGLRRSQGTDFFLELAEMSRQAVK